MLPSPMAFSFEGPFSSILHFSSSIFKMYGGINLMNSRRRRGESFHWWTESLTTHLASSCTSPTSRWCPSSTSHRGSSAWSLSSLQLHLKTRLGCFNHLTSSNMSLSMCSTLYQRKSTPTWKNSWCSSFWKQTLWLWLLCTYQCWTGCLWDWIGYFSDNTIAEWFAIEHSLLVLLIHSFCMSSHRWRHSVSSNGHEGHSRAPPYSRSACAWSAALNGRLKDEGAYFSSHIFDWGRSLGGSKDSFHRWHHLNWASGQSLWRTAFWVSLLLSRAVT